MRRSRYLLIFLCVLAGAYFLLPRPGAPVSDDTMSGDTSVDAKFLGYFPESYRESRERFRSAVDRLRAKDPRVQSGAVAVPTGERLSIDWLYVPARRQRRRLIVLTSGLHGAEAPAGAAVQLHFLDHIYPGLDHASTGVFLVHAINPHGYANFRRATANNVDLNRNFGVNEQLFELKNPGYDQIDDLLNPRGPARAGRFGERLFFMKAISKIAVHGINTLRRAALQGQYEHPQGIYFGGDDFEPHVSLMRELLRERLRRYDAVFLVDLHTGYGDRGALHVYPVNEPDADMRRRIEDVYGAEGAGYELAWANEQTGFFPIRGDFMTYVGSLLKAEQIYVPVIIEYGTMNSRRTAGAIESIHRTILENQGAMHGYAANSDELEIKRRYREMFFPSSERWRSTILRKTRDFWDRTLHRYGDVR